MGTHNTGLFEKKKLLFDFSSVQPVGTSKRHGGGKYGEIVFKRILESIIFLCMMFILLLSNSRIISKYILGHRI